MEDNNASQSSDIDVLSLTSVQVPILILKQHQIFRISYFNFPSINDDFTNPLRKTTYFQI